jgi:hypothetical protein
VSEIVVSDVLHKKFHKEAIIEDEFLKNVRDYIQNDRNRLSIASEATDEVRRQVELSRQVKRSALNRRRLLSMKVRLVFGLNDQNQTIRKHYFGFRDLDPPHFEPGQGMMWVTSTGDWMKQGRAASATRWWEWQPIPGDLHVPLQRRDLIHD